MTFWFLKWKFSLLQNSKRRMESKEINYFVEEQYPFQINDHIHKIEFNKTQFIAEQMLWKNRKSNKWLQKGLSLGAESGKM